MNKGFDIYTLEFDVYTDNLRDSDYSFTVNVDTPQVQNYDFHGANVIKVFNTNHSGPAVNAGIGPFTDQTLYHVRIDMDVQSEEWTIWHNGRLDYQGPFFVSGSDVQSLRFSFSPWLFGADPDPTVSVAIDNIRVFTVIPEPVVSTLLCLGGIRFIRRRDHQRLWQHK